MSDTSITADDIARALGLQSCVDYLDAWASVPLRRIPRAVRPLSTKPYVCRKCINEGKRRPKRHHRSCLQRGRCHALRGENAWRDLLRQEFKRARGNDGSGRTTRMLCKALAVVASGQHVLILGYSFSYTMDLVRKARQMAHECGIDGGLVSAARQDALLNQQPC